VKKEIGMRRLSIELRKRRSNQKGFTLIEMLVVISILGILAAIVTMSMVGITNTARSNAQKAEKQTLQVAMDTMASDQGLATDAVCPDGPSGSPGTNDMSDFPHPTGTNGVVALYPKYIRIKFTSTQTYYCDANGTVHGNVTG
jgi:prepilin-type N-terminal cleavage/methylation domain-containing protein